MSAPLDPLLSLVIEPPWPYRRRKLARTWPAMLWVVVALGVLVREHRVGPTPATLPITLICISPAAILPILPMLPSALRGIRAGRLAFALNARAVRALETGDFTAADALLREALALPHVSAPTLPGLVYNLGVVATTAGDAPRGAALMAHARASGWFQTWAYRWRFAAPPE